MSIFNWVFKLAKNYVIKHIDKNNDGKITPEEILDFAMDIIEIYEKITGEELEIIIPTDDEEE